MKHCFHNAEFNFQEESSETHSAEVTFSSTYFTNLRFRMYFLIYVLFSLKKVKNRGGPLDLRGINTIEEVYCQVQK
jgi:hypothetical protein